jgi:hypothetical protein
MPVDGDRCSPRILVAPSEAPLRPIPRGLDGLTMHGEPYPPSLPGTRVASAPISQLRGRRGQLASADHFLGAEHSPWTRGADGEDQSESSTMARSPVDITSLRFRAAPVRSGNEPALVECRRHVGRQTRVSPAPTGRAPNGPSASGRAWRQRPTMLSGAGTRAVDDREHGAVRAWSVAGLARRREPTSACSSQCRARVWSVRTRARSDR